MADLSQKSREAEYAWHDWVETAVPRASKLTKEFREGGWVKVGLRDGWEGVKAVFQARNAIPSAGTLQDLRRETEDALNKLRPLYEGIEETDRLIDQIVYRLYGLTEGEISAVEESVQVG